MDSEFRKFCQIVVNHFDNPSVIIKTGDDLGIDPNRMSVGVKQKKDGDWIGSYVIRNGNSGEWTLCEHHDKSHHPVTLIGEP